ncbi:MAG: sugar phosphate isomerase/epimerase [Chitinophagaceae bacterium]|nr:sugar phosphate isomerase/epimerase [Chitinophagaceae bacterium]
MSVTRRNFIKQISALAATTGALSSLPFGAGAFPAKKQFFEISLAEWSLHKALFAKKITNLDFPGIAKKEFGINVVEYVNQFFKDKANDTGYLNELLKRCKDNGVKNHLIMVDGEGGLADLDDAKRMKTVENHYKWVDAAKYLGCSTIRVNSYGEGSAENVQKAAIDGLGKLGEYGEKAGINIIVENHGGYSSNGMWLAGVMKGVNMKNVGALPDFGNFCIKRANGKCEEEYDRYKGVAELMPFAKGASAKTYDFDAQGNCIETDYLKMMKIVKDSGFTGYVGIEYEGSDLGEEEGIKKTKALLEKVRKSL